MERRVQDLATANEAIERRNEKLGAVIPTLPPSPARWISRMCCRTLSMAAHELAHARYAAPGAPTRRATSLRSLPLVSRRRRGRRSVPTGPGLLSVLISDGKPLRIPDISKDPRNHGFPPNHASTKSFLGAPILFRGKLVGDLHLPDKLGANDPV
ncbi:MAG: GAF domain-containing protein [Chloroflexota bacterium]